MAGNRLGALKARDKNLALNPHFYEEIGRLGGVVKSDGGFKSQKVGKDGLTGPERARIAGQKGGRSSRRGPSTKIHVTIVE